jgi:hypothetical protein
MIFFQSFRSSCRPPTGGFPLGNQPSEMSGDVRPSQSVVFKGARCHPRGELPNVGIVIGQPAQPARELAFRFEKISHWTTPLSLNLWEVLGK